MRAASVVACIVATRAAQAPDGWDEEFSLTNAPWPSQENSSTLGKALRSPGQPRRLTGSGSYLDAELNQAIVKTHNWLRGNVDKPCTASDMEEMIWDDGLATAALDYAMQCLWKHDPTNGGRWGENMAMNVGRRLSVENSRRLLLDRYTGWVKDWYAEIRFQAWTAGAEDVGTTGGTIGHYTQVIWAESNRVGCGATYCTGDAWGSTGGHNFVCRYLPAGNMAKTGGGVLAPYLVGAKCATCKNNCVHGLCKHGTFPNRACTTGVGPQFCGKTAAEVGGCDSAASETFGPGPPRSVAAAKVAYGQMGYGGMQGGTQGGDQGGGSSSSLGGMVHDLGTLIIRALLLLCVCGVGGYFVMKKLYPEETQAQVEALQPIVQAKVERAQQRVEKHVEKVQQHVEKGVAAVQQHVDKVSAGSADYQPVQQRPPNDGSATASG